MAKKIKDRNLFRSQSFHAKDFVVLNSYGKGLDEFSLYAEAYRRAAQKLVAEYGISGAVRDFEATPILFLYRHSFELYLKTFVLIGSKILFLAGLDSHKFSGSKSLVLS